MVENRIVATVDLNEDIKKTYLNTIFATKDSNAHQVDVYLYRGKEPVTLKGTVLVKGYFIRYSENVTAILNGTVDGNKVSVTLEPGCYNKPGQFALVIKVTTGNEVSTVFYGEGSMCVGQTDEIFYEDYIIMDVEEMLSHIKEMEEATADAREATEAATTATQLLETEAQTQITRIEQRAETLEAHIISEANRQVAKVETATQEFLTDNPDVVGPQGEPGVGIQSVEQTTTSTADGGSNISALAALSCLEQQTYLFTLPAFDGASKAYAQMGALLNKCLTITGEDVEGQIEEAFLEAENACK